MDSAGKVTLIVRHLYESATYQSQCVRQSYSEMSATFMTGRREIFASIT